MPVVHNELRKGARVCIGEGGNIGAGADQKEWKNSIQ